jgi:hypothetical protein
LVADADRLVVHDDAATETSAVDSHAVGHTGEREILIALLALAYRVAVIGHAALAVVRTGLALTGVDLAAPIFGTIFGIP